jgi:hypothetical protein
MIFSDARDALTKTDIVNAFRAFIEQRPGFEAANYYGAPAAYRYDARRAQQGLTDARALLAFVAQTDGITANDMLRAIHYYGHRIGLTSKGEIEYVVGQYFPTEYRQAASRLLASMIWVYLGEGSADDIRARARHLFGRGLASRYFN